jgi:aspartate aminotransferase-like enzyme
MKKRYLLTPGPTPLPSVVREAASREIIHHRTKEFQEIFAEVNLGLKYLFQTRNDIFTFAASGTGAMEAAVVNLLSAGDRAIAVCGGKFGQRWREIAKAYGVEVLSLDIEWGKPVEPGEIKRLLSEHQDVQAVFTTLCETSTAVVSDIKAIGRIVKESNAVLVVDAISGLGAEDLQTDNWHVDCAIAGSQKGMMLPPGLGFASVSAKAYEKVKSSQIAKYYFDFNQAKKSLDKNDTPFTPAVSLVVALKEALDLIKREGLENVFKRHRRLARATRGALLALGFKLFSATFCNVVTAAYVPEGIDSTQLVKLMREKFAVSIANGQGRLKGKVVRLAHLGYIQAEDIITGIASLEKALSQLGHKVGSGKGVQAAKQILAKGA